MYLYVCCVYVFIVYVRLWMRKIWSLNLIDYLFVLFIVIQFVVQFDFTKWSWTFHILSLSLSTMLFDHILKLFQVLESENYSPPWNIPSDKCNMIWASFLAFINKVMQIIWTSKKGGERERKRQSSVHWPLIHTPAVGYKFHHHDNHQKHWTIKLFRLISSISSPEMPT